MASQSGIAVWRFHDLPHMNRPDFIVRGMEEALGWTGFEDKAHSWDGSLQQRRRGDAKCGRLASAALSRH